MRTLLHVFPSFAVGGAQMRFARLANHFGPRYRHLVVSLDGAADCLGRLGPDVPVRLLDLPACGKGLAGRLRAYRRMLADLRPDLLVTSNWGAIEWAMANADGRVPHLHMEDGFGPDESGTQLRRRVWARRLLLRRATLILPSQVLMRIAAEAWGLPPRRLLYVPNGIDCRRFAAAPDPDFAARLGLPADGPPIVGTVAALRPEKNIGRLLEALSFVLRQRPVRLAIVGDGPQRPALERRAAELGVERQVVFTGACPTPERLLPSFAAFALSSDTEQMPLSLLEAMAAGRPVAATAVGDTADMVAVLNRPFVVGKHPVELAEAILALLADPDRAASIGAANARRAREVYPSRRMVEAYGRLFDGNLP